MGEIAVDAIVNAAKSTCLGGGGVDGMIHDSAGDLLERECATFNGCPPSHARITKGYSLPAKFVIHTVGPIGEDVPALASAYRSCLQLLVRHQLRSIAFCCVSTGIFGFPLQSATETALQTVREWLGDESNAAAVDRIVFACFKGFEVAMYEWCAPKYFPRPGPA